ncbi:MAG: DUF1800 family protein [Bdellovibrionales bacterium]|nr:DUF1800 family protein [Bdellovibrionales bacterium]
MKISIFRPICMIIAFSMAMTIATPALAKPKKVKDGEVVLSGSGYDCIRLSNGAIKSGKAKTQKNGSISFSNYKLSPAKKRTYSKLGKQIRQLSKKKNPSETLQAKLDRLTEKRNSISPKERAAACQALFSDYDDPASGGDESPGPVLNFQRYTGPFGIKEAQRLYSRFAYGASRAELQAAVARGLEATVEMLLTWTNEPAVDAGARDIMCDEYLQFEELHFDNDPDDDNEVCNPINPLDFEDEAYIQSLLYKRRETQNPLIYRIVDFFHDERMAAQCQNLQNSQRHFQVQHFNFLESVAKSFNYANYIRGVKDDALVAYVNLDLGENSVFNPLQDPNENFAREWLELASTSPMYKGSPVYTPFDIAQLALALTGRGYNMQEVPVGYNSMGEEQTIFLMNPAIVPSAFVQGNKTIFMGTPFETVIVDADDAADAILSHPAAYYHFAEELLKEFLHPNPSTASIDSIAADIQAAGGNFREALRKIMLSQEFFNSANEKILVKSPIELMIGFLRQTDFPYSHRNLEDDLEDLGQDLCLPGNRNAGQIFGWDNLRLASEAFVVERRNAILGMVNYLIYNLHEDWNYDIYTNFVAALDPSLNPADALVDKTSELLGISLNAAQKASAVQYLNYNWETCDSYEVSTYGCTQGEKFAKREAFDPAPDAPSNLMERKVAGLLALLATTAEYNLR